MSKKKQNLKTKTPETTQKNSKKNKTIDKKPQVRHKLLFKKISENIGKGVEENMAIGKAMRDLGYSTSYSESPDKLTKTKSWTVLMEENIPDSLLAEVHKGLLKSTRVDHLVFPPLSKGKKGTGEFLTDEDIIEMLEAVNCKVRKIVHGEQARHVYFWSADNRARKDGLDMAFKLKNKYAPETMNLKFAGYDKTQLIDLMVRKLKKK